ncbi:MAG: hypothetical protein HMLIMOIP_002062 [Candidatus Nitrosomirales archaeon]|jgi:hypothetical protein
MTRVYFQYEDETILTPSLPEEPVIVTKLEMDDDDNLIVIHIRQYPLDGDDEDRS